MKLLMENWNKFVNEEHEIVLTEREKYHRSILLSEAERIDKLHLEMEQLLTEDFWSTLKDELPHLGLDVLGVFPGLGEAADLTNAALYAKKGEHFMAALSAASMIPIVGDIVGKGGKLATMLTKYGDDAAKVSVKLGGTLSKHFPKIKSVLSNLKGNKLLAPHIDNMLGAVTKYIDDAGRGAASVGKETLEKVQQAVSLKSVAPVDSMTVKNIAKKAVKQRAVRKRREMAAGAVEKAVSGGEPEEEEIPV